MTRHLKDNPSLKPKVPEAVEDAYGDAVQLAIGETDLPEPTFPTTCPWSFDQMMDEGFRPEQAA